jgi:hypothetical protein
MNEIITSPLRVGRHVAIWLIWHSTGVSLLPPEDQR